MTRAPFLLLVVLPLVWCAAAGAAGADEPGQARIVATIDGEAIREAEVIRAAEAAVRGREPTVGQRRVLLEATLDQVIDRRLILRRLVRTGEAASGADVDFALAQLEKELAARDATLAERAERSGTTLADVRHALHWQLSWQKYLDRHLTEANFEKYYLANRRDFDGTRLKVAHILFKASADDATALANAGAKADEVRGQIVAGKLSFAQAAAQHSAGPSAQSGGDLGWIERHEPMPAAFSEAAFALQPGEISPPVATSFGVHLVQVQEVKAGTRTWQEAAGELKPATARYLFRWLADKERATATVERVGTWPE
ncbi:MAG: peptidylprolyl isomerase [Pirellulaceae bacterium]